MRQPDGDQPSRAELHKYAAQRVSNESLCVSAPLRRLHVTSADRDLSLETISPRSSCLRAVVVVMPSCLRAIVSSCHRAVVASCRRGRRVAVSSCCRVIVSSCRRVFVPWCRRVVVSSCFKTAVPGNTTSFPRSTKPLPPVLTEIRVVEERPAVGESVARNHRVHLIEEQLLRDGEGEKRLFQAVDWCRHILAWIICACRPCGVWHRITLRPCWCRVSAGHGAERPARGRWVR